MTIIWCMVTEIWSAADRIFCHFGLFSALLPSKNPGKIFFEKKNNNNNTRRYHFTHVYHKWKSYDAWFLRYGVQQTIFFFHFLPFYPTNNLKNKNFENFLEISFDMSGPQMTTTWYMAPVIWSMTDIILCHFGLFLSFYLPSPP